MGLRYWPWRWLTRMAGTATGFFSWLGAYPRAALWQLAIGGFVGSLAFTLAYEQIAREVRQRRDGDRQP